MKADDLVHHVVHDHIARPYMDHDTLKRIDRAVHAIRADILEAEHARDHTLHQREIDHQHDNVSDLPYMPGAVRPGSYEMEVS